MTRLHLFSELLSHTVRIARRIARAFSRRPSFL